jgi:ketosteroid isomerase-like protein
MLSVLIAFVFAAPQPEASKDAFDLKQLYRLEAVWNDAHVKGDIDALDQLWANDLLLTIAAMPAMKKADALAMVRSNRMPFTKYETSELDVKRFTDSALVTGRLHRERTMNGKNVTDEWRFTKVYVMSQGQWRVIHWHASPAAP